MTDKPEALNPLLRLEQVKENLFPLWTSSHMLIGG